MSLHEHDLKSRLVRFLGRKAAPRHLVGKDGAQADEVAALVAAAARCAFRESGTNICTVIATIRVQ